MASSKCLGRRKMSESNKNLTLEVTATFTVVNAISYKDLNADFGGDLTKFIKYMVSGEGDLGFITGCGENHKVLNATIKATPR